MPDLSLESSVQDAVEEESLLENLVQVLQPTPRHRIYQIGW